MKYDLEKNNKRIEAMAPGKFEAATFLLSLVLMILGFELKLELFCNVCGWIFLMSLCHGVFWIVDSIIYIIIKKKKEGKKDAN